MGNRLTKEQKIKHKDIQAEWNVKRQDKIILWVGDAKCGKTQIINTRINDGESIKDLDWANTQYSCNGFIINQYYSCVECAASNYKYLNIVLNNMKIKKKKKLDYNASNDLISSEYSAYKPLIVSGLYRATTGLEQILILPNDIVNQICQFIPNPFISSYIYYNDNGIEEFWDSSIYDRKYFSLLYKCVHSIIFVANISQLHTLNISLDLFDDIVKECREINKKIRPSIIVFLTESNMLKEMIEYESINLNEYQLFGDYKDEQTNSEKVIDFIKHKFERIMDGYYELNIPFIFLTSKKKENMSKVFWYCETAHWARLRFSQSTL